MTTLFRPIRAVARHNDPLMAAGIDAALAAAPGIEVVAPSDTPALPAADVVICDYETGVTMGRQRRMRDSPAPPPGLVVVTWRDGEGDVRDALQAGIGGYLLGNCRLDELVGAVRAVGRGSPYLCELAAARVTKILTRTPLTTRETQILRLIARGMPNKSIASELRISLGTVKSHTKAILDKLGARNRTEATVLAAQWGLLGSQLTVPAARAPRAPADFALVAHEWSESAA